MTTNKTRVYPLAGVAVFALLAACAPAAGSGANTAATLPQRRAAGPAEVVATFPELMPTGVTVAADGRTFVNFPRWEEGVPYTVAELVDGEAVPYPDLETNRLDESAPDTHFISVQSVVVGPDNRLWVLDTGRPLFNTPPVGPKLVAINLDTNQIEQTISFSDSAAVLDTTYFKRRALRPAQRRGGDGVHHGLFLAGAERPHRGRPGDG